jgi:hypothetical protein
MRIHIGALRLGMLLAILVLAGCATGPKISTNSDPSANFAQFRSFAFHDPLAVESDGYATPASQQMRQAARREMEARGYVYDPASPDLWVNINAYMVERTDLIETTTLQHRVYYDYRANSYVSVPFWSDRTDVHNYTEGTLNIDLVDARARRLVWEGIAVGRTGRLKPAERAARIDQAMAEIFAQYPHRAP